MKSNISMGYLLFLSVVAAIGGYLFGYDTAVISGTISQITTLFHLDEIQEGWYVGCALIGSIVGVSFAGQCAKGPCLRLLTQAAHTADERTSRGYCAPAFIPYVRRICIHPFLRMTVGL